MHKLELLLLIPPLLTLLNDLLVKDVMSVVGEEKHKGNAGSFDASGCGVSKGCLMKPVGCTPHVDCAYALSFVADKERVYFELLGQVEANKNAYVSLGFSEDKFMGNDTVSECSSLMGQPFLARLSYNLGKTNCRRNVTTPIVVDEGTTAAKGQPKILRTHSVAHADGTLYCRFSQLIKPHTEEKKGKPEKQQQHQQHEQQQFVRSLDKPIHILMSSGTTKNNELQMHTLNADSPRFPFSSEAPVALTKFQLPAGSTWPDVSSHLFVPHLPLKATKNVSAAAAGRDDDGAVVHAELASATEAYELTAYMTEGGG